NDVLRRLQKRIGHLRPFCRFSQAANDKCACFHFPLTPGEWACGIAVICRAIRGVPAPCQTNQADRNKATSAVINGPAPRNNVTGAAIDRPAPVDLITRSAVQSRDQSGGCGDKEAPWCAVNARRCWPGSCTTR